MAEILVYPGRVVEGRNGKEQEEAWQGRRKQRKDAVSAVCVAEPREAAQIKAAPGKAAPRFLETADMHR
jgi:hypothetical protein